MHRKLLRAELKRLDGIVDEEMARCEQAEEDESPGYAMPEKLQDANARRKAIADALRQLDAADTDHLHPTEPDARMMKGRQMHTMGYNAQAVVDHESDIIVACDVVTSENDLGQLAPMLKEVVENVGRNAEQTVADAGYCSSDQLAEAERIKAPVLVSLRHEDATKGDYRKSNFRYDDSRDVYVCPRGEQLVKVSKSKSHPWSLQPDTIYRCFNSVCPVRAQCTTNPRGRQIRRPPGEEALVRQREKQQDRSMRALLDLRKAIVEHVFGILKGNAGFRRFAVRGSEKVRAHWALACSAINLRRLYACWTRGELLLTR